jgi:hypothetical protein
MFQLHNLQAQWVLFSLLGGGLLVLYAALTYLVIWRPREKEEYDLEKTDPRWLTMREAAPWVLIVTYVAIFIFEAVYTINEIMNPAW